ncbi:hypothetical protein Droror1_Dr00019297 [Drosera rotundifolia]
MSSYGWLLNTVEEVEPLGMSIIRNYLKVPIWPIGPLLPPEKLSHKPVKSEPNEKDECIQWLDQHSQDFVLYVSFVGWPLAAEQSYNSKMLVEEMGVSVELTRGLEGGLTKEEVKRVVELVMDRKGKGGELKRAAVEITKKLSMAVKEEAIQEGSSVKAMDDFINTVLSLRSQAHI